MLLVEFNYANNLCENRSYNFISVNFLVLRAGPGNSRESSVLAREENSVLRIRNMKEQGYNETKEVLITIHTMKSFRDTSLH